MDLYSFCLMLGAVGLASMAFLGLGARGGHSGHSHDAGGGHAGGHPGGPDAGSGFGHADAGVVHAGHHGGHDGSGAHAHHGSSHVHADSIASRVMYALISPRVLFSLLVGFGATGLVARQLLGGPFLLGAALGGALIFELAIVSPMWRFMMRFASNPALTLESAITDEVHAVTAFDEQGQGLIALEVDGQVTQILATLRMEDRGNGIHVRAGDTLRVESVDSAKNQCTVSYISTNRQLT